MKKIAIHLIGNEESIEFLLKKYQITKQELFMINPFIKKNYVHPGQIIYIPIDNFQVYNFQKNKDYYKLIKEIKLLSYQEMSSHIYNYNNQFLIEVELFDKLKELSTIIASNNKNEIDVINSHFIELNKNFHIFIDSLIEKDEEKINKSKNVLIDNLKNLSLFFEKKQISIDKKTLIKHVENHMLIAAKILSNNHYDAWVLLNK